MKRASLKTAVVPVISSATQDVTDRLLSSDPVPTPRTTESKPKSKRRAQPSESSSTILRSQPNTPLSTVTVPISSRSHTPDPITHALAQTRLALDALMAARTESSARYDVAIRVRLDSLAHHLDQVSQFITAHSQ
jgi:hypothetical protein